MRQAVRPMITVVDPNGPSPGRDRKADGASCGRGEQTRSKDIAPVRLSCWDSPSQPFGREGLVELLVIRLTCEHGTLPAVRIG